MKLLRRVVALTAVGLATVAPATRLHASVEDEVNAIQERVVAKAQGGASSESDFARELNELSDLYLRYRSQKSIASEILLVRANIYEKVIKDREMTMAIYIQIVTEYPGTPAAYVAASSIEAVEATADNSPPPSRARSSSSGERNKSSGGARPPSSGGSSGPARSSSASASTARNAPPAGRTGAVPEVGTVFPDFSLQDLDGLPLTLAQLRGQMVLVDFWATSCSSCVEEMDNVMAAYRRFHGKGFEIVGISLDRDRAPLKNFIRARTITWPNFFDEGGTVSRRYGITAPPSSFLLDREGKIVAVNLQGYALERALQKHLEP